MVRTVEEKKAYSKAYREANKEKLKQSKRQEYLRNKDAYLERAKKNFDKDKHKIVAKKYRKTEAGIKARRMSMWRTYGVKDVNDELYDYYMNCDVCEACGKEFTETINKCLDHDHETGVFRYVLCRGCNIRDNWKKVILNHTDTP